MSFFSVCIEDEAREGAILVVVASMGFASIQFDVNLIPCVQMEDDAVGGVVIVLVSVLGDGTGSNLEGQGQTKRQERAGRRISYSTFYDIGLISLFF